MTHRLAVVSKIPDARATTRQQHLENLGFRDRIYHVLLADVYTIDACLSGSDIVNIGAMLANPVTEIAHRGDYIPDTFFDWAIEIGFRPGVTDNVATTVREGIEDLLRKQFAPDEGVYTSQVTFLDGRLSPDDIRTIAASLANPLIQRIHVKSSYEVERDRGMGIIVPRVQLHTEPRVDSVAILDATDDNLARIGKQGIANADGSRRGPLALDLTYMKAIQAYFRVQGRNPTDVELEAIAQTWSEHCHHTIFADPIDDIGEGLFKRYIRRATEEIRKARGETDLCVSVFTDNSGAIGFDEKHLLTHKVETHNSPSALDPFGGAITGIVGVNRDTIGFGLGAKPVINTFGFCFGKPDDERQLYRGSERTQPMLSPRRIMDGVVAGVNAGGNCSGIPTPQGFVYFDDDYRGKPLVFVGTVGLIPRESAGKPSYEKKARPGDYIVMIGGRVGKDGIHGATFSSEAMDAGSPATAVQIGDPITQKKLSDAIVKEARDLGLYTSITDNGAGGLSCSVAEMAKESGGCSVQLDAIPTKYPGLAPWELWISESQERMTLAVPPEKWETFASLMHQRGVEATVIGAFTNSGKCVVDYCGQTIMDLDMDFLHNGLPPRPMKTTYTRSIHEEPPIPILTSALENITTSLHAMIGRLNIASFEFISTQYDHEVQGSSVLKPVQGRGRVNADTTITRPVLDSPKGVVLSQGIHPLYSAIDTYSMAACAIDTAIRNAVAAGADLDHLALLDNFCWCSSNEPERLGQLKAAAQACYDYAIAYGTPFISGKDSMFNDFKGFDEHGNPIKISVPPTLLISSIGVIDDVQKTVSLDAKVAGDLVYVIGETHDELGGSEYYALVGEQAQGRRFIGNTVPRVDAAKNKRAYAALAHCIQQGLLASAQSIHRGGLAVALAKTAIGGELGMDISLENLPGTVSRDDFALYAESQGRIVVTIAPENKARFEETMRGNRFANIGVVRNDKQFTIHGRNKSTIVATTIDSLLYAYKTTLAGY